MLLSQNTMNMISDLLKHFVKSTFSAWTLVEEKRIGWFAQVWCGPVVVGIDLLNQALIAPLPIAEKATRVGLSHANEIGTLFIAMAGLMNFVVLLDALQAKQNEDLEKRGASRERRSSS